MHEPLPPVKIEYVDDVNTRAPLSSDDALSNAKTKFVCYLGGKVVVDVDLHAPLKAEIFQQLSLAEAACEDADRLLRDEYDLRVEVQKALARVLAELGQDGNPAFASYFELANKTTSLIFPGDGPVPKKRSSKRLSKTKEEKKIKKQNIKQKQPKKTKIRVVVIKNKKLIKKNQSKKI